MCATMDLLHHPDCPPLPSTPSLHPALAPSTPPSPHSHRQAKRVCLSSVSDQTFSAIPNRDQGGGPVIDSYLNNSRKILSAGGLPEMTSRTSNDFNISDLNNKGHSLDSTIIQSKYSEEELAAEPLLGVADWLNCTPSAVMARDDRNSPAPKYHSQKGKPNGLEDPNEALKSSEILPTLPVDEVQKRVTISDPTLYVWDLDETLIIFQTLRNGRYAELHKGCKDPQEACELGKRWESLILDICDDYFFYKQVENFNEPSLLSLQDFDDGADLSDYNFDGDNLTVPVDAANKKKLAYRHRFVGGLYERGLENLLTQAQLTEWKNLYEATDTFTDGWLTAGRELLETCQNANQQKNENQVELSGNSAESIKKLDCDPILKARTSASNYNILVTSGTLVPSLVKCLLFRLDKFFHHLNIYSSREVGKLQCFQWIRERVQRLPLRFCVIGDGVDEAEAANELSWPFLKIHIGPNAVYQLPTVSMEIINDHMKVVYDPSVIP
ncbi:hypothetical protein KC19_6G138800 [Ceratodon purpureus]|uniref:protein-tyrosine-phosphatase n=1 Tax=Ceratodon purpureus TaxID=3225 RepID=A0A8T0HER4_CERPU|nr:hypothetical protein KC19_6G138800 [Ceratodon purpureus]